MKESVLVAPLVQGMKAQQARIEALTAKIAALETRRFNFGPRGYVFGRPCPAHRATDDDRADGQGGAGAVRWQPSPAKERDP
jgi:hypothetical protein